MLFVTDEVSVITGFVIAGCHCIGKLDLKKWLEVLLTWDCSALNAPTLACHWDIIFIQPDSRTEQSWCMNSWEIWHVLLVFLSLLQPLACKPSLPITITMLRDLTKIIQIWQQHIANFCFRYYENQAPWFFFYIFIYLFFIFFLFYFFFTRPHKLYSLYTHRV